jgi:transketolase
VRKEALNTIEKLLGKNEKIVFIGSDLGSSTFKNAKSRFPKRVFIEGISEQHLIGFAAGLALEGFIPFVHTIGTFLTRRALEQIIVDVALQNLSVKLIASGGGMVYAPLGPTHQSIDDFAIMRSIPNMVIAAPTDPYEMSNVIEQIALSPGPAYVRVAKGGEPNITSELDELNFGQIRTLRNGSNLAILTTGVLTHECINALNELNDNFIFPSLYHVPYINPFDIDKLTKILNSHDKLLIIEEHLPNGGLFTTVVEILARHNIVKNVFQLSLANQYATKYGSQKEHWEKAGLDSKSIIKSIKSFLV